MSWAEKILSPVLLVACSGIILALYITVRPLGFPWFVYMWCPLVAIVGIFIISWIFYDIVMIKRAAEEVVGRLQSRSEWMCRSLALDQRKELRRRAGTLRPIHLSLWNFADASFEVLANVWDEVLNQLLFLLSL